MQLAAQSQLAAPVKFSQLVDAPTRGNILRKYYKSIAQMLQIYDKYYRNVKL